MTTDPVVHPWAVSAFGAVADEYDAGRPGYPADAVRWIAQHVGLREEDEIVDLAAGTGKLSRELALVTALVTAVEPVEEMRRLLEEVPAVRAIPGTAEDIPLPSGRARLVTVGQAFHWFDALVAAREIHRVLTPRGWLAVLRNDLDLAHDLSRRFGALIDTFRSHPSLQTASTWSAQVGRSGLFSAPVRRTFANRQRLDPRELHARVHSESSIALLGSAERRSVDNAVERLRGERSSVELRYETVVFLYQAIP